MKQSLKVISLLLSLALLFGMLASCGTDTAEEQTAADRSAISDTINVYTALEDDIIQAYLVSFYEKYPNIEIKITRDATGTIVSKLIAEKDNPIADVVWGTAVTSILSLGDYDLIEPYDPEGIERVLPQFKDKMTPARWVGIEVPEGAMVVDRKALEAKGLAVPTGFDDLIKPEYKGLIQAPDPTISGTGLLILSGILQLKGEEAGWEYLDALNKNIDQFPPSGSKPAKNVDAGETAIGLSMGYRCVKLAQENPDLEVVFPVEGCPWDVEANLLIKKPVIKEAAKLFLDWAISDPALEACRVEYPIVATGGNGTVPEGYNQDPVLNLSDKIDLYAMAAGRDSFFTDFTEKYLAPRGADA
ncbi:MAG: extracellular solute-binding protein [Oscillospiraceae bacterium]|jgi:iron(III) transport system substrate-binding protein|nr:extracellular solute-binding protein [Oscillospiraceae bacterium]